MDFLSELMKSKKPSDMDDNEMGAKSSVLEELLKLAEEHMGGDVKGLKQVTVAAPDSGLLKAGLDKAKDVVGGDDDEQPSNPLEMAESKEDDDGLGDMKPDEIDALIAALQAKKAKAAPAPIGL